ncbi:MULTISPECIES: hypothetical protein [unclassified Psychrobacter]|uniref:hypothetical protein n=1 Tax=unclassified Psychrobacter TaxID=196806 RepID=UPI0025FEC123|nr:MULTISPECIES: hypothetical protein [unclassified Psychrobacter]
MSDFENEVKVLGFTKTGSICSATVIINVEIDVMVGFSGKSEIAAKDALLSEAFNQLRTDVLGEDYE